MTDYTWANNPCVRYNSHMTGEEHPCYYCRKPTPISLTADYCEKCGGFLCPSCGKCWCNTSEEVQKALQHLRDTYCCNRMNFYKGLNLVREEDYLKLVPHFKDALDYCRKQEGYIR